MSNILIADPNPTMRRTLAENVRGFGHTVFEAENGGAALKLLAEKKIQVFFLDVEVLEREEPNCLAEACKISPASSVLIVLGLGEDGKKWSSAGAFATVTKPFNIQGLRRIINEAVANSKSYVPKPAESSAGANVQDSRWRISKKTMILAAAAALAFLSIGGGTWAYFKLKRAPKAQVYSVPYENLSSIAISPDSIWLCDWFEQAIIQFAKDGKLSVQMKANLPALHPSALAWDGKNLWSFSAWDRRLVKHEMATGLPSSTECTVPEGLEIGTFCKGKDAFWIYDVKSSRIGKLSISSGAVQVNDWYAPIGSAKTIGMFWEEGFLWTVDESGRIYEQSVGSSLSLEKVYMLPPEIRGTQGKLAFFAKDGKTGWVGAEGSKAAVSFPWNSVDAYKN